MRKPVIAIVCLVGGCWMAALIWLAAPQNTSWAQEKGKKTTKKKGNSNVLDVKANEIQGGFIKSAEELAGEYYDLKEFDKARVLLKSIQALDPNRPNLEAKLKLLDEDMISSNETEVEVNANRGWEAANVLVTAGKPIRLKAEGSYKFVMNAQLGPQGFVAPKTATPQDMVHELPMGALIGIVIPNERPGQTDKVDDKKKDKAFVIGEGCDYTALKDGTLFIRINAPPESKNSGKLKVKVSGGRSVK